MRNHLLAALLLSTSLVACGKREAKEISPPIAEAKIAATAAEIEAETTRLNAWFDELYEEQLKFSPIQRTFLGRKDDYNKIDDFSDAAQDAQLAWQRKSVDDLKSSFDYERLMPEAKISYDIWVDQAERALRADKFRRDNYVFTQMQGPQAFLPQFLIVFHKVDEPSDMDAYVARIGGVALAIDQLVELAKLSAAAGTRPPRFAYEGAIQQARAVSTGAPFGGEGDSPIWADAQSKIAALKSAGEIDDARAASLAESAKTALIEKFKPSYDALIAYLEDDLAKASPEAQGVGTLVNGQAYYNERLSASTTTALTATEIHQIGLDEVRRLQAEMGAIKTKVGFKGSDQEFYAFLRDDPQFYFPNDDEGAEVYLEMARSHLGTIKAKLPEYFGILPKADLVVKRVEAFREQPGAAQHYFQGAPDGSRPGIYYAHLSDMKAMPKYRLEAIAYHEGVPGHHMQISIAQELQGVPQFRTQAGYTAFAEGWGLYAELLAKDMGGYEDPYSDYGRLSSELWRAIRLVVDTGIHSKGWSEQQAIDYCLDNSPRAETEVRSEVRRFFVVPGQATAYKIGMLKIVELRNKAKIQLGDRFDIRQFHDVVLGGGEMPLELLERRVDRWITTRKAS
jgi:uncharacterized protein (DUF885 family)